MDDRTNALANYGLDALADGLYRNAAGGHYDHDDGCECKLCELFRECASNAGPACGHSACSQNYIETGDRMCIADTDDTEPKGY